MRDKLLAEPISRALDDLGVTRGRPVMSPAIIEHIVRRLAHEAFESGRHDALMGLLTLRQAAIELGTDPGNLSRRAKRLGIGWDAGTVRLFTPEDVARLRTISS